MIKLILMKFIVVIILTIMLIGVAYADPQMDCRSLYRQQGMEVDNLQSVCKTEEQIKVSQTPQFSKCLRTYVGLQDPTWHGRCSTVEWVEFSAIDGYKQCLKVFKKISAEGWTDEWQTNCNDKARITAVHTDINGFKTCQEVYKSMNVSHWMNRCDSELRVTLQKGTGFKKCLELFRDVGDSGWINHCDNEKFVEIASTPLFKTCLEVQASTTRHKDSALHRAKTRPESNEEDEDGLVGFNSEEFYKLVEENCSSEAIIEKALYGAILSPGKQGPGPNEEVRQIDVYENESTPERGVSEQPTLAPETTKVNDGK